MSFLQRMFKRKQNKIEKSGPTSLNSPENGSFNGASTSATSISEEGSSSELSGKSDDEKYNIKMKKLIRRKRRLDAAVSRKCDTVVAMEAEVTQLMKLIKRSRRHIEALDEDMLSKHCEMTFLKSQFPEGCDVEAKKREPLIYKRFTNVKTAGDAKSLLTNIRQRQRALTHLELMTYNKHLELTHQLKSPSIKKRNSLLMKDKVRNFGHIVDVLSERDTDTRSPKRSGSEPKQSTNTAGNQTVDTSGTVHVVVPVSPLTAPSADNPESEHSSATTSPAHNTAPAASRPQSLLFSPLFGLPSTIGRAPETAL